MDALTFLERFGKAESEAVATAAGTNYAYFSQIAYGHRTPSAKLAKALVDASKGRLDFQALLLGIEASPKKPRAKAVA